MLLNQIDSTKYNNHDMYSTNNCNCKEKFWEYTPLAWVCMMFTWGASRYITLFITAATKLIWIINQNNTLLCFTISLACDQQIKYQFVVN